MTRRRRRRRYRRRRSGDTAVPCVFSGVTRFDNPTGSRARSKVVTSRCISRFTRAAGAP